MKFFEKQSKIYARLPGGRVAGGCPRRASGPSVPLSADTQEHWSGVPLPSPKECISYPLFCNKSYPQKIVVYKNSHVLAYSSLERQFCEHSDSAERNFCWFLRSHMCGISQRHWHERASLTHLPVGTAHWASSPTQHASHFRCYTKLL